MCRSNEYTFVYPDGRRQKQPLEISHLCSNSRSGRPCSQNTIYQHPPQAAPYSSSAPVSAPYLSPTQFPPTPNYSPRSSTPNYRSGDESDRSAGYHSGSSASRRAHASRPPQVYINGQKVYTPSRHSERIVLVEGPPTPRTPPRSHATPHTAPPSPSTPFIFDATRRPSSSSRSRPVIVDDRPRVEIDIREGGRRVHSRNTSSSSYSYEEDSSSSRRQRRDAEKEQRRQAQRDERVNSRIAQANAEISSRPAVPMPPQPPRRSNTSAYSREADLVDAVRRLDIRKDEQRARRRQEKEDEAQRERLRERMMPRRRATVGPGSRRNRDAYGEGMVRWE